MFRFISVSVCLIIALSSCTRHPGRTEAAFYYWKNGPYHMNDPEKQAIKSCNVHHLYIKLFEVKPDPVFGAIPFAKQNLNWSEDLRYMSYGKDSLLLPYLEQVNIIPTVYITNSVFKNARVSFLDSLSDNIVFLIKKRYSEKTGRPDSSLHEIQIDCDWTLSTKDRYFRLLKAVKARSGKKITCTLRLYPYKFPDKMGVPPVDRVSLMCYNLLSPYDEQERNSILDMDELKKYLNGAAAYPLPLDVALPLFSWVHIYQHNRLVNMLPLDENIREHLTKKEGLWYDVTSDLELDNIYLRPGDRVKIEDVTMHQLTDAINEIKSEVSLSEGARIQLFHLDETVLKQYRNEEIQSVFGAFTD